MKKFCLVIMCCLLLCSCNNDSEKDKYNDILTKEQMQELMKDNDYVIVDVRTKDEYENSHIVDAINISHLEIDEDIDLDKNQIIFVYCRSGSRSSIAKAALEKLGYTVYNLGAIDNIDLLKE